MLIKLTMKINCQLILTLRGDYVNPSPFKRVASDSTYVGTLPLIKRENSHLRMGGTHLRVHLRPIPPETTGHLAKEGWGGIQFFLL